MKYKYSVFFERVICLIRIYYLLIGYYISLIEMYLLVLAEINAILQLFLCLGIIFLNDQKMKIKLLYIFSILFITSCSNIEKNVVSDYIAERNNYNFEAVALLLNPDYKEYFIDGSLEIESLDQLKDDIAWGKIMDSKTNIISMERDNDIIITVEEFTNFMDLALDRQSRSFKMTYIIQNEKILKATIDTLPGFTELTQNSRKKYQLFQDFCTNKGIDVGLDMNEVEAKKLREALTLYQKSN